MKRKGFCTSMVAAVAAMFLLGTFATTETTWAQAKPKQQGAKKVYRWVDENGEVHYSETLPPDWQGETHDELGHDGIVREEDVSHAAPPPAPKPEPDDGKVELPRDKSGLPRPEPKYSDAEKQQQMDRLLMLRYRSEDELLEEMDIEINQLKYDERLLTATQASLETSLKSSIDVAGNRQRAGLEVNDETLRDIAKVRARLEENQRALLGLQKREEKIREDFNRSLERWRELSAMYSEEETG